MFEFILSFIPTWAWWVLGAFTVLFIVGIALNIKQIAGWPGVVAIVGIILTLATIFWPRAKEVKVEYVKKQQAKKKKRTTIFETLSDLD